jgi:hypothetical protein
MREALQKPEGVGLLEGSMVCPGASLSIGNRSGEI